MYQNTNLAADEPLEEPPMNFDRATCRRLHEAHETTLDLMARLEARIARRVPPLQDASESTFWRALAIALKDEIRHHFDFEEQRLFPLLDAVGEADIGALLAEEHAIIREVGESVLAHATGMPVIEAGAWTALRESAAELVERLTAHIQKEEMALLPALEQALDEVTDRDLSLEYAAG